ncbi:MAG: ABC transporter substrate-binding protein [Zoogloeaceae bacterium]|jgi:branched-chain amino acid transport system substrate-binding protein|nr:ABC transporter substrate-binding protein [Zoogloeaceae bacterium]
MFPKYLATFAATLTFTIGAANAQVRIGVIASSTGPVASIGIPQKNSAALLPIRVGDLTVEYVVLDDGSDPTAAVTAAKKLINEHHVDAIIGPSGSPQAMGLVQFVAEAGTPMIAPVGSAGVVLPMNAQKKWVFKTTQNDSASVEVLLAHMAKTGIRKIGVMISNDAFGENRYKEIVAQAKGFGLSIVANEKYQRGDTSVMGQVMKLIAAKPEAIFIACPGSPAILPQATLRDKGYKGRIYQSDGAALEAFLKQGGKKVEGTILQGSMMLVLSEIPASNPSRKVMSDYVAAYEKRFGKAETFGSQLYDAGLLVANAIPVAVRKAKPGTAEFRAALRDALEATKDFVATQGRYSMTPENHSGMDKKGANELITVQEGKWRLVR